MPIRRLVVAFVVFASSIVATGCSARGDAQDDGAQPSSAAAATARLGGSFRKKEGHGPPPTADWCFRDLTLGTDVLENGRSPFDGVVTAPCRRAWEEGPIEIMKGEFEADDTTLTLFAADPAAPDGWTRYTFTYEVNEYMLSIRSLDNGQGQTLGHVTPPTPPTPAE